MLVIDSYVSLEMFNRQFIFEKLVMPTRSVNVSRPRLTAMLEQGLLACTSTILAARAGAGKTTLAIDFALKSGRQVAWYKVDAPDGEVPAFFDYLAKTIHQQRPSFSVGNVAALMTDEDHGAARTADAFVHAMEESHEELPLLIVIEDLHLVSDASWVVPFFRRWLPLIPADVHVLITSRTMPPAPLWRMRSKQTLAVIDEEMLKFTRQEAIELFGSLGLSAEQACIALDHTNGRASALASFAATLSLAEHGMASQQNGPLPFPVAGPDVLS